MSTTLMSDEPTSEQKPVLTEAERLATVQKFTQEISSLGDILSSLKSNKSPRSASIKTTDGSAPTNYSKGSNVPYYKRTFAEELKPVLDDMELDRKPRVYYYESFPNLSKQALYLRISQAWQYLQDAMDEKSEEYPEGKYRMMRARTTISKRDSAGIKLVPVVEGSLAAPTVLEHQKDDKGAVLDTSKQLKKSMKWKLELDDFIEAAAVGQICHITKLTLSEGEQQFVKEMFLGLSNFLVRVSAAEIKVVCVDPNNLPS